MKMKSQDDKITIYNNSGLPDPTAYHAILNIERERSIMSIKRGDVFYVEKHQTYGSEQQAGRPAVIVSNDINNDHSDTFEVVYLTTQPKNDLPTHVTIRSTAKISTALCEQVSSVYIDRIGDCCGRVTKEELESIDVALMISLGLKEPKKPANSASSDDVQAMKSKIFELEGLCEELNESVKEKDECVCDMNATILDLQDRCKRYKDQLFKAETKNEVLRELYESSLIRFPGNYSAKD